MRLRIRDVQKAMAVPYTGPRKIPATTFTRCWMGKHLEAPTGMEKADRHTPKAVIIPAAVSFLTEICITFLFLFSFIFFHLLLSI